LNGYLDLTVKNAPTMVKGFAVIDRKIVRGPSGKKLRVLGYTGETHGRTLPLPLGHHVGVRSLRHRDPDRSREDRFVRIRTKAEPYMVSLRAT
jgi:hypothetical protein